MVFLAHEQFGYSLIEDDPRYFGKLKPSQMHALFEGLSRYNKKQSDASKGKRHEISSPGQLAKVPGVKIKRKS